MIDSNIIITLVPPIVAGVFAYLIARKKNVTSEKINKAKVNAEIQTQALEIVHGVMNDMRDEFHREINSLKTENDALKHQIEENGQKIEELMTQRMVSDKLIETLKSELAVLRNTIRVYENEIERLKKLEVL